MPEYASRITNNQAGYNDTDSNRRQLASFGELTYHVTDALDLTAGLRYSYYSTENSATNSGGLGGGGGINSTIVSRSRAKASKLTQKYNANYKVTPDNIVYAQAAQGFRDGNSQNPLNRPGCATDLALLGLPAAGPSDFFPDSLWSYEVGSKNTLLDRRVTLNGSAYYTDWQDIQQSIVLPGCGASTTINAGTVKAKGFELASQINPVEGLVIGGSIAYTDAKITEAPVTTPALKNNRLPLVPAWQWSFNAQYDFTLSSSLNAFVRTDITDAAHRWSEVTVSRGTIMPGYMLVGARIGVGGELWTVALYATNLLNKKYPLSYNPNLPAGETLGDPRVVGVNANYKF